MAIDNLFSTPLYYSNVDNYDVIQEEVAGLVERSEFKTNPNWGNNHQLSDPNFTDNPVNTMENTKNEIFRHVGNFLEGIKFQESLDYNGQANYVIAASWLSRFGKGQYAHVHSHAHHEIAGVYYHKVKGDQGQFFIECPVAQQVNSFILNHRAQSMRITPQPGMIMLFPGFLNHGVYANETDDDRISLSFNISFQKPYFMLNL